MSNDIFERAWGKAIGTDRKQFNMFFDRMMDAFAYHKIVLDKDGKAVDYVFLEVNDAFEKMTGLKKEQIIGKKVTEVLKGIENDPADWIGTYGKVALTCESIIFENYAEPLQKWYKISAYCPEKGYFVALFEDVTERKKAEDALRQSEERFFKAFNKSPAAVIITRLVDGRYIDANETFLKMFEYKRDEVIGHTSSELNIYSSKNGWREFLEIFRKENGIRNLEMTFRTKTGKLVPTIISVEKISLQGEDHILTTLVDITRRKTVEEALRQSEQRWSTTLSSIGDAVIATDMEGKVTFLNIVAEKLTGWNLSEAKQQPLKRIFNIINENTRQEVENPVVKVLEKGIIVGLANHTVLIRKDCTEVPIDDSGAPIRNKDGKITGVVLVFRDITERKKVQEKIAQQAFMIENANDAIIGYDLNQKVTFWNRAAEHLYGFKAEEALGKSGADLLKGVYANTTREKLVYKLSTDTHVETESVRQTKDGRFRNVEAHVILLRNEMNKPIGYVSVDRDITERKKTEAAIQRQAALIDLTPDAIIVRKLDGTITFWSKGAEKLYGWTKDEAIGKTTHQLFDTKFPHHIQNILSELNATKHWSGELVHKTKDGQDVTVQSWWLAEETEHEEIQSILESNVDLTERKRAEKEISRLASFPTLNPNPVFEVDFNGNITYANPATKLFFPDLEVLGIDHPFLSNWQETVEYFEDKTKHNLGKEVKVADHWYHVQFYHVPETQQIRIYTVDIDELKIAEEARIKAQIKLEENAILLEEYANQMEELANQRAQQLKDAERMAAIGQTAGMVGHDIRNPLQAITSDMYLITEEVKTMKDGDSKQAIFESVESVTENLNYINKIVSDLQDYTRPLKPNLQIVNLTELIEGTLLTINVPRRIQVITDVKDNAKPIMTDIAYLRRILANLMTNAVQAMPNEGKLTIKAYKKNDTTIVTVEDTGVGIPEHVKTKMFTPLFTTKSKGQGLGLAVVKRLVESLKGNILFESEENKGTKFTLEFAEKST